MKLLGDQSEKNFLKELKLCFSASPKSIPKRCINIPINQGCHSREGGNPDRNPGFRVKPGMTDVEGLQK
jgi:hypothetical protein